jgi:hypothetical protein
MKQVSKDRQGRRKEMDRGGVVWVSGVGVSQFFLLCPVDARLDKNVRL